MHMILIDCGSDQPCLNHKIDHTFFYKFDGKIYQQIGHLLIYNYAILQLCKFREFVKPEGWIWPPEGWIYAQESWIHANTARGCKPEGWIWPPDGWI